jgi:hypothetical protein
MKISGDISRIIPDIKNHTGVGRTFSEVAVWPDTKGN